MMSVCVYLKRFIIKREKAQNILQDNHWTGERLNGGDLRA